jgi:hypothetical protein
MLINATHNGQASRRKPDVVLVSYATARDAFSPGDTAAWDEYAFNSAANSPKHNFEWRHPLLTAEFKRKQNGLDPPPARYDIKLTKSIPPQTLPATPYETDEIASIRGEAIPRTGDAVVESSSKADFGEREAGDPICDVC